MELGTLYSMCVQLERIPSPPNVWPHLTQYTANNNTQFVYGYEGSQQMQIATYSIAHFHILMPFHEHNKRDKPTTMDREILKPCTTDRAERAFPTDSARHSSDNKLALSNSVCYA